ncbi:MAG: hypothetical protein ACKO5E_07930 [bacterium]
MVSSTVATVEIQETEDVKEMQDSSSGWVNRQASARATRAAKARNSSGRRRFVDPTTCEREYDFEEMEFLKAIEDYKKSSGRAFPTWSEVLEVVKSLGYVKVG